LPGGGAHLGRQREDGNHGSLPLDDVDDHPAPAATGIPGGISFCFEAFLGLDEPRDEMGGCLCVPLGDELEELDEALLLLQVMLDTMHLFPYSVEGRLLRIVEERDLGLLVSCTNVILELRLDPLRFRQERLRAPRIPLPEKQTGDVLDDGFIVHS